MLPQISQLNALITLLIGNLSAGDRMKIMTICTIDVHARDVVAKMITAKARAPGGSRSQGGGLGLRTPASIPHPSYLFFLSGAGGTLLQAVATPSFTPSLTPGKPLDEQPNQKCPRFSSGRVVLGLMGAPGEDGELEAPQGQGPLGGKPACSPRRWRAPRPSPGSPSCGTAGTRSGSTALPTSATPRSSIHMSTWATRRGWSSPHSRTGEGPSRLPVWP